MLIKWLINIFKKKDPVSRLARISDEQLREIGEKALREVASKKIVTNMIEENRRQRDAVKTAPSSNAKPLDAEALRRRAAQRKSGVELLRVLSQNTPSRRNDDDTLLTTATIANQIYSSPAHHSPSSSHTHSHHDDGGSYSSGSCDSGSGSESCD